MTRTTISACLAAALVTAAPASAPASAGVPATGLEITFLPSPATQPGKPGRLGIRVVNGWDAVARGITLAVVTPGWVRIDGRGCTPRKGGVACSLPDLRPRAATVVRLAVTPTRSGTYRIVARATATLDEAGARSLSARTAPAFRSSISPVGTALARRMTGVSWRPGCPVPLRDLRVVRVSYWGFDGRVRTGSLVVHRDVAAAVATVLRRLYEARFPIRRMQPVDAYGGDDFRSIEADNTSAFNCRPVAGTSRWSEHAYGHAIDLDPLENPSVSGGRTSHAASRRYLDRSLRLPGMIHAGDEVVRAFAAAGWGWGGTWSGDRDYQHFSRSGR
jgi:hypothetical protein